MGLRDLGFRMEGLEAVEALRIRERFQPFKLLGVLCLIRIFDLERFPS